MSKETLIQAYRTIQELERRLKESRRSNQDPIAIVGMACRFPGARNPQEFFDLLRDGRDAVTEVPRDRWDIDQHYDAEPGTPRKMYTRSGCFLDRVDEFDADFFQVAPREARMMDPQQRLLLEVSWEALEDAGLARLREPSIGVFVGVMHLEYGALAARRDDAGYFDVHSGTGCEMSVLAGRLSHFLNLRGPSMVVGTACSSSLAAVHLACQSLRSRECRAALAGGVSLMLSPDMTTILCRMRALARDGHTKAFDDAADGYGRGEGCGVVVLKRLDDALNDGDHIWGVLRGSAINHDGPSGGLTVPSAAAQEMVIRNAMQCAGFDAEDVDYLEAHGTGTPLGDPIEMAALARVFKSRTANRPLWIGSVKANIGHLEAAAGVASLMKVALALKYRLIPRQVHFENPNRHIPWNDIPIQVVRENTTWPAPASSRRAAISAFGLSGINAHVLVEEAPAAQPARSAADRPRHVLTLSARTPESLRSLAKNLERHVAAHPEEPVPDLCFTMNTGRAVFACRWAACVATRDELLAQLRGIVVPESPAPKIAPLDADALSAARVEDLAHLFTQGVDIDWARFDRPYARRRLSLPTYPFQRESHWLEPPRAMTEPSEDAERTHPLLGRQILSPALRETVFETRLSSTSPAYLAEHRVHRQAIMPAAAMLEWAALALASSGWNGAALEDFQIRVPLALSDRPVSTQLILDTEQRNLRIASNAGTAAASNWTTHATARVSSASATERDASVLSRVQARCSTSVPVVEQRERLKQLGLEYGPIFCGLQQLHRNESEAVGFVELPPGLGGMAGGTAEYRVHPALLDACMQTASAWLEDDDVLMVPTSIDRFQWYAAATPLRVWSHARQAGPRSAEGMTLDFRIFSETGELLGQLDRVQLRSKSLDWFYEVAWQPAPLYIRTALSFDTARAKSFWNELNDLCASYIEPVIAQFNRAPELVVSRHRELLLRLKETLPPPNRHYADTDSRAARLLALHPDYRPEVELVMRTGSELASIVQGRKDPLEVLFGNNAAETLYRESVAAQALNALVAREAADAIATSQSTIHILEIGGGTAGTTRALLPLLADHDVSYTFTDIAPLLLTRARQEFTSHPYITVQSLDIERSPAGQGLRDAAYDLIIAANVVHATRSLEETLRHIRQLLRPGGKLILVEGTEPQPWLDMTFGLTEGWWRFADRHVRPYHPLLHADQWRSMLCDMDFGSIKILPEPEIRASLAGQAVITAIKGGAAAKRRSCWLILADQGQASRDLRARIESWDHECVILSTAEFATQRDRLMNEGESWRGIVHLSSLDAASGAGPTVDLERSCGSALTLIQALLRSGRSKHRVWFITRGAQSLEHDAIAVSQSPLWAVARTLRQEHPEIACTCVDLDPADDTGTEWLDEFTADDGEREIVYRDGIRYSSRLRRSRQPAPAVLAESKLVIDRRGSIDGLRLVPAERHAPRPREVTIEVEAAGLNFLDVLDALGILPFDRSWIGGECAGRIVLAGEQVTEFAAGDEVVALAPGSFATSATVSADLVARKPRRLSFQQAATLPVATLTASRCFELAGVQAGTRILIHAAAGGVGLAAIGSAKRAGAEIFATAGSEEKRAKLRALGVEHLYSSRSTDFTAGILETTQGQGVDVVLNCLKGDFIPASLAVLASGGRFVEIGKTDIWTPGQVARERPDVSYIIYDLAREVMDTPVVAGRRLRAFFDNVSADPDFEPLPHRTFPLGQAPEAFRWMAQSRHFGKIVLVPRAASPARSWRVRADASYLITGAFGGLGLWMCDWLAQKGARHIVLWGRRDPPEKAQTAIAELRARDVEVVTRVVDVAAVDQVRAALETPELRTYPLRGILHCAGVLDDGLLRDLTWERFLDVLRPKALGAWNLHEFTRDCELDWFVLFSSAASLLGSAGQANHAAANAFLDGLAHLRRAEGLPALSINWGAWDQIGAAARKGNQQGLSRRGVRFISPGDARQALIEVQRYDVPQLGVFPIDWDAYSTNFTRNRMPRFLHELIRPAPSTVSDRASARWSDKLQDTPAKARPKLLANLVQEEAQQILGRKQPLDPHQPLREAGLDSLLALELCNHLGAHLGMNLSPTLLFDYPTIAALTGHLLQTSNLQPSSAPASAATSAEPASIEELASLLTAELASTKKAGKS